MAVLGLALALVVTVRVEERRVERERERVTALALEAANVAAERDRTRDIARTEGKVAKLLGDSLRVAERLVVQARQHADALDQALGRERRAKYALAATVDSLSRAVASAPVANDTDDVRRARFDLRQAPYTIAADVAVPAPPDSARLAIDVALDSIPIDLRMGCSTPDQDGIRAATVDAITPRWATVRFARLEQAPELCASPALASPANRSSRRLAFHPLVVGFGPTLGLTGTWAWALFLGGGFSSW
jgi:hypothetical protein